MVWVQHSADGELDPGSGPGRSCPSWRPEGSEPVVEQALRRRVRGHQPGGRAGGPGSRPPGDRPGPRPTPASARTLHGAFTRGYDATLVSDAHTAGDKSKWGAPPVDQVIAHTNLYWSFQGAPGRTAGTAETAKVDFSGPS